MAKRRQKGAQMAKIWWKLINGKRKEEFLPMLCWRQVVEVTGVTGVKGVGIVVVARIVLTFSSFFYFFICFVVNGVAGFVWS